MTLTEKTVAGPRIVKGTNLSVNRHITIGEGKGETLANLSALAGKTSPKTLQAAASMAGLTHSLQSTNNQGTALKDTNTAALIADTVTVAEGSTLAIYQLEKDGKVVGQTLRLVQVASMNRPASQGVFDEYLSRQDGVN